MDYCKSVKILSFRKLLYLGLKKARVAVAQVVDC